MFNGCEQFNRDNIGFNEGVKVSIDSLCIGFTSLNTGGTMTSIHQKIINVSGDCETKLDAKGTLCQGMKTSITLNK